MTVTAVRQFERVCDHDPCVIVVAHFDILGYIEGQPLFRIRSTRQRAKSAHSIFLCERHIHVWPRRRRKLAYADVDIGEDGSASFWILVEMDNGRLDVFAEEDGGTSFMRQGELAELLEAKARLSGYRVMTTPKWKGYMHSNYLV